RLRVVDCLDERVRDVRAEDFAVEHAWERDVVGKLRRPDALRTRVHLAEGTADDLQVLLSLRAVYTDAPLAIALVAVTHSHRRSLSAVPPLRRACGRRPTRPLRRF